MSIKVGRREETPRGEFTFPKREVWVYFGSHNNKDFGAGVCRVPAGSNNEPHDHKEGDEVIYVIKGTMRIVIEGEEAILNQGDAVLVEKNKMHQIFNPSAEEELLHTFVFTPPAPADAIGNGYGRDSEKFKIYPPEKK